MLEESPTSPNISAHSYHSDDERDAEEWDATHSGHAIDAFLAGRKGMVPAAEVERLKAVLAQTAMDYIEASKLLVAEAVKTAVANEWREIHKWKPYLHFCDEWDGLLINIGDPEFKVCRCELGQV